MTDQHATVAERARRTRAVCVAIERAGADLQDARVRAAAHDLWSWLDARFPQEMGTSTMGGLDAMPVPPGGRELMRELYAAASVCDSLAVYYSADTFREMADDADDVVRALAEWRRIADSAVP